MDNLIEGFRISDVYRYDAETVKVIVYVDAVLWAKLRKKGDLGQLYGIDISNRVFREYGVKASNPTVGNAEFRAKRGVKRLTLEYADAKWVPTLDRDGDPIGFSKLKADFEAHEADSTEFVDNVIHVDFIRKCRKVA